MKTREYGQETQKDTKSIFLLPYFPHNHNFKCWHWNYDVTSVILFSSGIIMVTLNHSQGKIRYFVLQLKLINSYKLQKTEFNSFIYQSFKLP